MGPLTRSRPEVAALVVALGIGAALIVLNITLGQSLVDACPLVDPPPLACRPDVRGGLSTAGIVSATVLCLAAALMISRSDRLSRGGVALLVTGGTLAAGLAAATAIGLGLSQRL